MRGERNTELPLPLYLCVFALVFVSVIASNQ